MTAPALELNAIEKHFGSVHALRGADFVLAAGEVHCLLGENGAGKTTLMHVAYGLVRPDAGEIRIGGRRQRVHSPRNARAHGVGMVHQHFTSVPAFTVAENVALAAGWPPAPASLHPRGRELCERVGLPLDPAEPAGRLSVGLRQRLEIVKAVAGDARVLLLDEPTAVLAPAEIEELLQVIRRFTVGGGSVVLITHKLDEALAAADRVTVLRRGTVVGSGPTAQWNARSLTAAMIGSEPTEPVGETAATPRVPGERILIRAESLEVARENGRGLAVRQVSLTVHAGEVVGIAGVEGNGQRELLRAVAGRLRPLGGRLEVAGPVGFIPEDRVSEGLVPEFTLTENVVLASTADDTWISRGRIDWAEARGWTAGLLERYGVVAPGPEAPAWSLSGGNQQRVVVARELSRAPAVVVAENPTRGLDIRATREIHRQLLAMARRGTAVLLHSSDLDEVLALADRVVVASRGALIPAAPAATRAEIGALMLAGGQ